MKVLLTGTSGNLGSRVLAHILNHDLIPSDDIAISTTSPHNLAPLAKQNGIELISGDFTCSSSSSSSTTTITDLAASFATTSADILFLVSFPSPSIDRWLYHRNAIDAAKQSGCIKLIVYTSLMYGGRDGMHSIAGVQAAHIRTVEYLRQCGLEYVVLREGIYAESWWLYCGFQDRVLTKKKRNSGDREGKVEDGIAGSSDLEFVVPSDGPVAWVSWDDLGEGTALILARLARGDREWIGKTLNLTGPRTATIGDIARLVERSSGRKVAVKCVGKEEAKRYYLDDGAGRQEWFVDTWVGWFDAITAGECAVVDPLLGEILGREPRGMEEVAEELFAT